MKSLLEFYNDKETSKNVHNYLTEFLKDQAIKKVFDKEDVSGVAQAKEIIDAAFENLEVMFLPKVVKNTNNEAR